MLAMTGVAGPYARAQFVLQDGDYIIGQGPGVQIPLSADPGVSESHLRLTVQAGAARYEDLGSLHGSFVNGRRTIRGTLNPGDQLQVGASIFVFQVAAPQAQPPPPQPQQPSQSQYYGARYVGFAPPSLVGPLAPGWETAGLVLGIMSAALIFFFGGIFGFIGGAASAVGAALVYSDMRKAGQGVLAGLSPRGWAALVLLFWLLGVVAYLVYRPEPQTRATWPVTALKVLVVLAPLGLLVLIVAVLAMLAMLGSVGNYFMALMPP